MENERKLDGGFCALAGFLYQFIGSFRYRIEIQSLVGKQGEDQEVEFLLEAHDQDVAVLRGKGKAQRTLVQFKYSVSRNTIDPAKLKEICEKFEKAKKRADENQSVETDFLLVTNQKFGREAQKIWDDGRSPSTRLKDKYGNASLSREESDLLEQILPLTALEVRDKSKDIEEIRTHMRKFGVLEEESWPLIKHTVGYYFSEVTSNSLDVNWDEFHKELIGFPGARPLQEPKAVEVMKHQMRWAKQDLTAPNSIRRRNVERAIQKALDEFKAMILLDDPGGNGKSMTLCRIIESSLPFGGANDSPLGKIPFGAICHSSRYKDNWLSQQVELWRGRKTTGSEFWDTALTRLEVSQLNSDASFLVLGLDGLDEIYGRDRSEIDELIHWFREEEKRALIESRRPRAILVATCREPDQFEISHALPYQQFSEEDDGRSRISVGPFEDVEFALAMYDLSSSTCPEQCLVYARLFAHAVMRIDKQALGGTGQPIGGSPFFSPPPYDYEQTHPVSSPDDWTYRQIRETPLAEELLNLAENQPSAQSNAISNAIYTALLHPVLWRCFEMNNPLLSPSGASSKAVEVAQGQLAFLNGNQEACNELVSRLTKWFVGKCDQRHKINVHQSRDVLKAAAQATGPSTSFRANKVEYWINPAAESPFSISRSTSQLVFNEALSSGLIESDSADTWRWRHPFLRGVLAQ